MHKGQVHNLSEYQTRDPFEMIKGMNVILVPYPLEGVRGFCSISSIPNIDFIWMNDYRNWQRFVLAHELGTCFCIKG